MAVNENWVRWIFASTSKYFVDRRGSYTLYLEGAPRQTSGLASYWEFRLDGPYMTEISKDFWNLYIEISIIVSELVSKTNIHSYYTSIGKVASIFPNAIPVYKYGSGAGDDGSQLGCFVAEMDMEGRARLQVNNFGIVEPSSELQQGTVEGHYNMQLKV